MRRNGVDAALDLLGMAGFGSGEVPEEFASIYGLLDDLPTEVTDRVVGLYFNQLTRYRSDR